MGYWDRVAEQKRFSHPLRVDWLRCYIDSAARILDYGCGYGRTLRELSQAGHENIIGVDFSHAMLVRCRRELPGVRVVRNDGCVLPFESGALV